jgi:hypothetical protein
MIAIDAMHNLLLGLAKSFMKHLTTHKCRPGAKQQFVRPIIDQAKLDDMDTFIKQIHVPSDLGRLPRRISSMFHNVTADELKLFVLYYSLPLFKRLKLDDVVIQAWKPFVYACSILLQRSITNDDARHASTLLQRFCELISVDDGKRTWFGKSKNGGRLFNKMIKPNHHLAVCHLHEVIADWGPVTSYWAFALERFNGEMADARHNGTHIETSIMRSFLHTQRTITVLLLEREHARRTHQTDHSPSVEKYTAMLESYGYTDLTPTSKFIRLRSEYEYIHRVSRYVREGVAASDLQASLKSDDVQAPMVHLNRLLIIKTPSDAIAAALNRYYTSRYTDAAVTVDIGQYIRTFSRMCIFKDQFGSVFSRGQRSSYVSAYCYLNESKQYVRYIGNIQGFFKHSYKLINSATGQSTASLTTHFAYVQWYYPLNSKADAFETAKDRSENAAFKAQKDQLYVLTVTRKQPKNQRELQNSVIPVEHIVQRVILAPVAVAENINRTAADDFYAVPIIRQLQG